MILNLIKGQVVDLGSFSTSDSIGIEFDQTKTSISYQFTDGQIPIYQSGNWQKAINNEAFRVPKGNTRLFLYSSADIAVEFYVYETGSNATREKQDEQISLLGQIINLMGGTGGVVVHEYPFNNVKTILINHNLGRLPIFYIFDVSGRLIDASTVDIAILNKTDISIEANQNFSGKVVYW